jgi:hypothetical protein
MLTGAPFEMSCMFSTVVFGALLRLETGFTKLFKFSRVITDARSPLLYHSEYRFTGQMSQPCMNQEIPFPRIQTLDYVESKQRVVRFVVVSSVWVKIVVVETMPEHGHNVRWKGIMRCRNLVIVTWTQR